MSTEDDEKLARALQAHYEKQASRRVLQTSAANRTRNPQASPAPLVNDDSGISSGSDDEDIGGNPRRPRRGGRRNRLPPSSHKSFESGTEVCASPGIHDTIHDAAIARKVLEKERLALKLSNHERSSHQRTPPLPPPFVPDTTADSELARRLAEEGSLRGPARSMHPSMSMERSGHRRSAVPPEARHDAMERSGHRRSAAPPEARHDAIERSSHRRSAAPPEPKHDIIERSNHRRSAVPLEPKHDTIERSSHRRSAAPPEPKQDLNPPDTSKDAELARLLAEEGSRRGPGRSQYRPTSMEQSGSHQPFAAPSESKQGLKPPDTSKDAELARRLAEGSLRGRSPKRTASNDPQVVVRGRSPKRSTPIDRHVPVLVEETKGEVTVPDTSKDAEIARRLAQGDTLTCGQSPTRHHAPVFQADPQPHPDVDTSKDEEIARRLANEASQRRQRRIMPVEMSIEGTPPVDDDEALARKLQQELKDEELARRLHASETKRRRRTSFLARKKAAQRDRDREIDGDNGLITETAAIGQVAHDNEQLKSGIKYQSDSCTDGGSGDELGRGRSHSRTRSNSHHRSKSRDSHDDELLRSERSHHRSRDARSDVNYLNPQSTSNEMPKTRQEQAIVMDLHETANRNLALKLAQESRDEALARSLSERDTRRISVYQLQSSAASRGRNRCTMRRILSFLIPVVLIFAAIVGLIFAFSGSSGVPTFPSPPTFNDQDPFHGSNSTEANRWDTPGPGLTLEVLNALDDRWNNNFAIAIDQWDNGNPDALSLSVTRVNVDNACSAVTGKLKVCNGDYGETKWRGINQVILSNGFIVSSVAKLNEFYLATADEDQRQYTTCHEIGHGFGLPHTDENFYNADLGNCMDYTSNPAVNKQPDDTNYAFLVDLYGEIPQQRGLTLRSDGLEPKDFPDDLHFRIEDAMIELEEGAIWSNGNFRAKLLHSNQFSEATLIDLQGGFQMQVNKLLA